MIVELTSNILRQAQEFVVCSPKVDFGSKAHVYERCEITARPSRADIILAIAECAPSSIADVS